MLKTVSAALLAASMIYTPVLAAGTGSSEAVKTAQPAQADATATTVKVKKVNRHHTKKTKRSKHSRHAMKPGKNVKQPQVRPNDAAKRVSVPAPGKPAARAATSGQR